MNPELRMYYSFYFPKESTENIIASAVFYGKFLRSSEIDIEHEIEWSQDNKSNIVNYLSCQREFHKVAVNGDVSCLEYTYESMLIGSLYVLAYDTKKDTWSGFIRLLQLMKEHE